MGDKSYVTELSKELTEEFGEEKMRAYRLWSDMDTFVFGFGNLCTNMEYAHVMIPTEDDLIYVWNSKIPETYLTVPFEHAPYVGNEKEHLMAVMRGEKVIDFYTEYVDGELLRDEHGFVVGGVPGVRYTEYQLHLKAGSRLFLYTDGLPEAVDENEQMFGIERALKALNEAKEGTPREVVEHVGEAVTNYAGSAPQFDDTTMLCLDYKGTKC